MSPIPNSQSLIPFLTYLGDNALILGHRNSEWCGHGPVLEQDIAITNISLDLIGQARNFYQYAALLRNDGSTEDSIAYLRDAREFLNCLLVEQPNGDWAQTILRQFFVSLFQHLLYQQLSNHKDEQLAAITSKALKEVNYHLRWSSEWVIRLGDGTEESHNRLSDAVNELWPFTGEFFMPEDFESDFDLTALKTQWLEKVNTIFTEATLSMPVNVWMQSGGKRGVHSEHMGFILADLQFLQRAYPGCEW